ncbi:MAG: hypothetical protein Q4G08_03200, partial [Capnocytophaga sp.]|nr:hypothetical protein [Capnocytophaga sp.]
WELTRMVYPDYEPFYGRRKENPNSNIVNYTGIVQDMIDGINENNSDRVSGYTIRQIEDALFRQNTWEGWRDNIIRIHNNPTERHLFVLFDYWN